MEKRYFIRDCNGKLIGNPYGYKTESDAQGVCQRDLQELIWKTYRERENKESNFVSSISLLSLEEVAKIYFE